MTKIVDKLAIAHRGPVVIEVTYNSGRVENLQAKNIPVAKKLAAGLNNLSTVQSIILRKE